MRREQKHQQNRPGCYSSAVHAKHRYCCSSEEDAAHFSKNRPQKGRLLPCQPPWANTSYHTRVQQALCHNSLPSSIPSTQVRRTSSPAPYTPNRCTSSTAAGTDQHPSRRTGDAVKGAAHRLAPRRLSTLQGGSNARARCGWARGRRRSRRHHSLPAPGLNAQPR